MIFWCAQHIVHSFAMYLQYTQNEVRVPTIYSLDTCQEYFWKHLWAHFECYWWSHVGYMLRLYSRYTPNVIGGYIWVTCWGYIPNVPQMWLVDTLGGKWSRACNLPKMFSLVSRAPRPQCRLTPARLSWVHKPLLNHLVSTPHWLNTMKKAGENYTRSKVCDNYSITHSIYAISHSP